MNIYASPSRRPPAARPPPRPAREPRAPYILLLLLLLLLLLFELCHLYPCPCPSQFVEQICTTK